MQHLIKVEELIDACENEVVAHAIYWKGSGYCDHR